MSAGVVFAFGRWYLRGLGTAVIAVSAIGYAFGAGEAVGRWLVP